jgi:hypothetical protein
MTMQPLLNSNNDSGIPGWIRQIFYQTGLEADALRAGALPLLAKDPTRMPDVLISGPDRALDEAIRLRFFGQA